MGGPARGAAEVGADGGAGAPGMGAVAGRAVGIDLVSSVSVVVSSRRTLWLNRATHEHLSPEVTTVMFGDESKNQDNFSPR